MFALIFGGSGSGKSEYAEKLSCELAQKNEKYYIATMIPYGEEGKKRVDEKKIKHFWSIFQTSSPSYVFMANMDKCISFLDKNGNEIY